MGKAKKVVAVAEKEPGRLQRWVTALSGPLRNALAGVSIYDDAVNKMTAHELVDVIQEGEEYILASRAKKCSTLPAAAVLLAKPPASFTSRSRRALVGEAARFLYLL